MTQEYKENWKRMTNKGADRFPNGDDTDLVRFQDQHLLTTNASGLSGDLIVGTPSNAESLIFRDGQWVYALSNASGLNGIAIVGAPSLNNILKFNGTDWVSTVDASGGFAFGDTIQADILQLGSVDSEIFQVDTGIIGFGSGNDGTSTNAIIKAGRVDATGVLFGPQGAAGRIFELLSGRVRLSTADYSSLGGLELEELRAYEAAAVKYAEVSHNGTNALFGTSAGDIEFNSALDLDTNNIYDVGDISLLATKDVHLLTTGEVDWDNDTFVGSSGAGVIFIGATTGTADGTLELANIVTTNITVNNSVPSGESPVSLPQLPAVATSGQSAEWLQIETSQGTRYIPVWG